MAGFRWHRQDADAWTRVEVIALSEALAIPRAFAVGHLALLESRCTRLHPLGNIDDEPARDIARACDFRGDPETFKAALVAAGVLGPGGFLESWASGQHVIFAKAERDRTHAAKNRAAKKDDRQGTLPLDHDYEKPGKERRRASRATSRDSLSNVNSDQELQTTEKSRDYSGEPPDLSFLLTDNGLRMLAVEADDSERGESDALAKAAE